MEFDILGLITYNKKMCNDLCPKIYRFWQAVIHDVKSKDKDK